MQRAKIKYIKQDGYALIIPRHGLAPLLFLEWLSTFWSGKMPLEKVRNEDEIVIKLNLKKSAYEQAAQYINDNL